MSEKNCILVVDDDEGVRKSLTLILRKKGYLVESAATGKEALAIAQGRSVSLTLLDVKLPDIMGTQLLAPLKQTNPDMSVIMITGFASVENAVQSLTAGASGYITKPIDLDGMLARIKTALDQQHLVAEVRRAEDALRESEEKFRGIFDTINDGIHIHEIEPDGKPGKFIEVNEVACRMLQYTREELLGFGPLDIVSGYHSRPLPDIFEELSSTGHSIFETEHRRKDGTIVPVEIHAQAVSLLGKRMTVSVVRDLTERKRAKDALLRVNQKLNVLSQLTRKDLTSQIFVLNSYLEITKKQLAGQDHIIETVQKGVRSIQSMQETIEYSKDYQDMGAKPPKWQNVNMVLLFGLSHISIGKIQHSLETENLE
ncbi:MAG: response regulator, partial [bacterium]